MTSTAALRQRSTVCHPALLPFLGGESQSQAWGDAAGKVASSPQRGPKDQASTSLGVLPLDEGWWEGWCQWSYHPPPVRQNLPLSLREAP